MITALTSVMSCPHFLICAGSSWSGWQATRAMGSLTSTPHLSVWSLPAPVSKRMRPSSGWSIKALMVTAVRLVPGALGVEAVDVPPPRSTQPASASSSPQCRS